MLRCTCGKTVENWRAARGHVKFKDDDTHGDEQDVPDDYRDLFTEVDEDGDEDGDDGDAGGSEPEPDPADEEPDEPDSEQPDGSAGGRSLREILTTPVPELIRGE